MNQYSRKVFRTLKIVLLFGSASLAAADAVYCVSPHAYRGVETGMSVSEAAAAYGSPLSPPGDVLSSGTDCHYVTPEGEAGTVHFMVIGEKITRIDIASPEIRTRRGVGIGSSESEVLEVYGERVEVSLHPYTGPRGHYLTVEFEDGHAVIFETDGSKVERYRIGMQPWVRWIEGCS
jgi:hypothetical protein